jgi:hypothetical protein
MMRGAQNKLLYTAKFVTFLDSKVKIETNNISWQLSNNNAICEINLLKCMKYLSGCLFPMTTHAAQVWINKQFQKGFCTSIFDKKHG